jgi:hypothetical protein
VLGRVLVELQQDIGVVDDLGDRFGILGAVALMSAVCTGARAAHRRAAQWRDQLAALDKAADAVSGNRFEDLSWVSAGRE